MAFCTNCGSELSEDAYFCPKCGARTKKAIESGVYAPTEDWRDTVSTIGNELEKAFTEAAVEVRKAFQTARGNIQKQKEQNVIVCTNCQAKNSESAIYCTNCGKPLKLTKA